MAFEFERQYSCLVCQDGSVIQGKIRAHAHISARHADLLHRHHIDELLEELPQQFQLELEFDQDSIVPPYHCLHDGCARVCPTESEALRHLKFMHDIKDARLGVHYEDEGARHARARQFEVELERFYQTIRSIETVADFLTECDA